VIYEGNVAGQVAIGKAFEYAIADAISRLVGDVPIVENKASDRAKNYFHNLPDQHQHLITAADEAIAFLIANDARFEKAQMITIQPDARGARGDVRDIVIQVNKQGEIGISAKHNHEAIKHSRLSSTIDFGAKWADLPVSSDYKKAINPIFADLRAKSKGNALWKDLPNKESAYYLPILTAFKDELERLCAEHGRKFIKRIFQYLMGTDDYYKVICRRRAVIIRPININGTLQWGSKWTIPDKVERIKPKDDSNTTLLVSFEGGWQISFRLHNASSKIEPSLKFDINFTGMSAKVLSHQITLEKQGV